MDGQRGLNHRYDGYYAEDKYRDRCPELMAAFLDEIGVNRKGKYSASAQYQGKDESGVGSAED